MPDLRNVTEITNTRTAGVSTPVQQGVVRPAPNVATPQDVLLSNIQTAVQTGVQLAPIVAAKSAVGSPEDEVPIKDNQLDEESIDTFNKIRQARLQGLMSPMEARAHVNALIQKKGLGFGTMERAVRRAAAEFFGDLGPGEGLIDIPAKTEAEKLWEKVAEKAALNGFISESEIKSGNYLNSPGIGRFLAVTQAEQKRNIEKSQIESQLKARELTQTQASDSVNKMFNMQQFETNQAIYQDLYPMVTAQIKAMELNPNMTNAEAMRDLKRTVQLHKASQLSVLNGLRNKYAEYGVVQDVQEQQRQNQIINDMYRDLENATDVNMVNTLLKNRRENYENMIKAQVANTPTGAALLGLEYIAPGTMREYMKYAPRIQSLLGDTAQLENMKKLFPESVHFFNLMGAIGDSTQLGAGLLRNAITGDRTGDAVADYLADDIRANVAYDGLNNPNPADLDNPDSAASRAIKGLKDQNVSLDNIRLYASPKSRSFLAQNPGAQRKVANVVANTTTPGKIESFIRGNIISHQEVAIDENGKLYVKSTAGGSPYVDKVDEARKAQYYVQQLNDLSETIRTHWDQLPESVKMGESSPEEFIMNHITTPAVQSVGQTEDTIEINRDQMTGAAPGDGTLFGMQLSDQDGERTVHWIADDDDGNPIFRDLDNNQVIRARGSRIISLGEAFFGPSDKFEYYDPADLDR